MPSFELTVSSAQATRIAAAFGRYWTLGRPATSAEVKEYLVRQLRGVVRQQERGQAEAALAVPTEVAVT